MFKCIEEVVNSVIYNRVISIIQISNILVIKDMILWNQINSMSNVNKWRIMYKE